ncbi:MAG: hypothetical protein ACPGLV_02090 [Bacteroidia bacterium]
MNQLYHERNNHVKILVEGINSKDLKIQYDSSALKLINKGKGEYIVSSLDAFRNVYPISFGVIENGSFKELAKAKLRFKSPPNVYASIVGLSSSGHIDRPIDLRYGNWKLRASNDCIDAENPNVISYHLKLKRKNKILAEYSCIGDTLNAGVKTKLKTLKRGDQIIVNDIKAYSEFTDTIRIPGELQWQVTSSFAKSID